MAYTETKKTSYGQRLRNSSGNILTGLVMFLLGTVLLWWNEGRAVKTAKMLKEAQKVAISVEDVSSVHPEWDGRLIHATAMTATPDTLRDSFSGLRVPAVKLSRKVEYYQWVEHAETETKDKIGGGQEEITTYTYEREWVSEPVTDDFKDPEYRGLNFHTLSLEDEDQWAKNVTFGAYRLPDDLIRSIGGAEPVALDFPEAQIREWDRDLKQAYAGRRADKDKIPENQAEADSAAVPAKADSAAVPAETGPEYVHIQGNELYFGKHAAAPEIGDMRIRYEKTLPQEVSVLAVADGDRLRPFTAKNGKSFEALAMGRESAEEMFQSEHSTNKIMLWIFRIVGLILVVTGLKNIFNLLITLLKVLPFLANVAALGINLVCSVIGFAWSLLVLALAWLFYRPLLGIGLLVLVAALIAFLAMKGKKAAPAEAPETAGPDGTA